MVKLRIKVGPKGQLVIPKMLREAYHIKEGHYALIEPEEDGLKIRGVPPPVEVIEWIRKRRAKKGARPARLGELADVDLEEEFED